MYQFFSYLSHITFITFFLKGSVSDVSTCDASRAQCKKGIWLYHYRVIVGGCNKLILLFLILIKYFSQFLFVFECVSAENNEYSLIKKINYI